MRRVWARDQRLQRVRGGRLCQGRFARDLEPLIYEPKGFRYHHASPRILSSFFFQAEDGIRDDLVTRVQTCALPICLRTGRSGCTNGTSVPPSRSTAPLRRPVPEIISFTPAPFLLADSPGVARHLCAGYLDRKSVV